MSTLLDTNIVTRCAQPTHPMCQPAANALTLLRQQGEQLCLVPQNFYEFWNGPPRCLGRDFYLAVHPFRMPQRTLMDF